MQTLSSFPQASCEETNSREAATQPRSWAQATQLALYPSFALQADFVQGYGGGDQGYGGGRDQGYGGDQGGYGVGNQGYGGGDRY